MNILVTGAGGFIGSGLVARLLASQGALEGMERIGSVTLLDQRFEPHSTGDPRVHYITGDLADDQVVAAAIGDRPDLVFHLASVPGGAAEADFELGLRVNLEGTLKLFEALRRACRAPRVVFASTIAVLGQPFPPRVDESTSPSPTLSYGAQKLAAEVLLNEYSRRGYMDGRALRLPGIVARPLRPSGLASAFLSDLIRILTSGGSFECPVSADGRTWLMSRWRAVDNLLHAAQLTAAQVSAQRVWLLPVLHPSIAELVEAIAQAYGGQVRDRVTYRTNAALEAQFTRYPPLSCPKSEAVGFRHDGDLQELIRRASL